MKKLWRVFLLFSQHALEYKGRSFVWFLVTLLEASIFLLFWRGALATGQTNIPWNSMQVMSYYLLLIVAGTFLNIHIEEEVAFEDIQQGKLSQYLTRPFSYLGFKFFQELPWRIVQGTFGLIALFIVALYFPGVTLFPDKSSIPFVVALVFIGYGLSFIYKMCIGVLAFWTTDFRGLGNLETIVFMLFAGLLVPLHFLPDSFRGVALLQPLAFILYYPILAVEGLLSMQELLRALLLQAGWFIVLLLVYQRLWRAGIRRFSAVGQ
jgi:ABC-2 type transport system permease protein